MRLHRLEVEGFGPFRSRQVVDFDAFVDDGIFLIAGRTGAGKSSILDAVCFGLYGGVPRYDGGEKRLRSDYCEPDDRSEVSVEFSTPAGRYRVVRSPEYLRPAKRGTGLTKQAAGAALEELTESGWVGRAARAVDVAHALDEILQLTREQFLQVILLAQNRFSEFLLAGSKERQALLRRLFGTERFDDVQARFDERRRASEQVLGQSLAQISARLDDAEGIVTAEDLGPAPREQTAPPSDDLHAADTHADTEAGARAGADAGADADAGASAGADAGGGAESGMAPPPAGAPPLSGTAHRIDELRRAEARASYRAERRRAESDDAARASAAADARLADVREERAAQIERDRSRAALAALDDELPLLAEAREDLARARSAEALRGVLAAVDRAEREVESAERGVGTARDVWHEVADGLGAEGAAEVADSAEALRAWATAQTRESGRWEHAVELESQASARATELEAARDAVAAQTRRVDDLARERDGLPDALAEAVARRDEARRLSDRLDDLTARRDQAVLRGEAVQTLLRLREESTEAERDLVAASEAVAAAQATLAQLRRRRLDGYAGELASTLVAHEPCPVCGSVSHPAPAEHADPVSADDIDAAEAARDTAARAERDAAQRATALSVRIATVEAAADGRTAETALAELDAIESERRLAADARRRLDTDEQAVHDLTARGAALADEHAAAERAASEARAVAAAREQSAQEAAAAIAQARGEFSSVRSRLDAVERGIAAATALAAAHEANAQRRGALAEAVTVRDAALADSPFDDPDAAREALRSDAEQLALEQRITRHAVQRETEKSILLPLEMRALPEGPIDVGPAEIAAAEARVAWTTAVEAAGRADLVVERLAALVAAAAAEHARSARAAAEHEVLRDLADTIAGRGPNARKMTLETFVLAAELEEIVEAANRRLHDMSTGRYQLRHSDALAARGAASGLGIVVHDAYTGQTRPAQSLSGGETFLSSLALALGLAEVVTARAGGIRLDTLFIDEGFGSLDGDTLDVAMRTLDELRQGGRTVGVISHVEAMQDQIPAQLRVRATSEGPSVIETR